MNVPVDYGVRVTVPLTSDGDAGKSVSHTASPNDQHLVLAAQSGCQTAFNDLWGLYSRRIYRTILGITNNAHDAEDAMQDSFLRAFLALQSFEGRSSFYSWLTRIAINSALGILRKRRSRPEISLDPTPQQEDAATLEVRDSAPNPEQIYARQENLAKLTQAIHELPRDLRVALQMRVTEDCSVKELACRLNISEAAAKSRLFRASNMLASQTAARFRRRVQTATL